MERLAADAASFIRECVERAEEGDDALLEVLPHFRDRMRLRGFFWADVVVILLEPERVETRGLDDEGRQQVWLVGSLGRIGETRIVCSIDWDTRLITLTWESP